MVRNTSNSNNNECKVTGKIFTNSFTNLTDSSQDALVSFAVLNGLTALPTFVINLLVMWTVLESRRLRSSNYNILVAILSVSDLLTGLVVQPLFISFCTCYLWDCSSLCELRQVFLTMTILNGRWTITTLAIVCLERYFYIQDALTYSNKVTTRKILITLVISWMVATLGAIVHQIKHELVFMKRFISLTFLVPTTVIITFCSIKLQKTIRRQRRAIVSQLTAFQRTTHQTRMKEFKRVNVIQVALFLFLLLFSPLMIIQIIQTARGSAWMTSDDHIVAPLIVTCIYLNSLINPFLYAIRLSDIRQGVKEKLPWFKETILVSRKPPVVVFGTKTANKSGENANPCDITLMPSREVNLNRGKPL